MRSILAKRVYSPPLDFATRLQRAFRGSEWVASLRPPSASTAPASLELGSEPGPLPAGGTGAVAVIGAQKFDLQELERWMRSLPRDTLLVTGDGRGAEQRVRELGSELGIRVDVPELRPDWFGPKARDCQVEQILAATSGDVVVVGKGSRTSLVERWHKRARWGRELVRLT